MQKKLKIALILDMHPFDEIEFKHMFDAMDDIEVFPQLIENYKFDYVGNNSKYDGFIFYNMSLETPVADEIFIPEVKSPGDTIFEIGKSGQGIVVLHHALLSHPQWSLWGDLVSIPERSFDYFVDVPLDIHVVSKKHPITLGMSDWQMQDETFLLMDCSHDADVILRTDCKKSIKTLAWVKQFKNSRVFVTTLGHGSSAYSNPNFACMLHNAIRWTCKEI